MLIFIKKLAVILGLICAIHDSSAEGNTGQALDYESQLMTEYSEFGIAAAEQNNRLNMSGPEIMENAISDTGTDRSTVLVTVDERGNLKKYNFRFGADGTLDVSLHTLTWRTAVNTDGMTEQEKETAIGSAEEAYRAQEWCYSDNGYFFVRREYIPGWDGAHDQLGIRVRQLDEKCLEDNRRYVLLLGYGNCRVLTESWNPEDMSCFPVWDAYRQLFYYENGCMPDEIYGSGNADITGDVHGERPECMIPDQDFEALIQRYFIMDPAMIRQLADYDENGGYLYRSLSFDEIDTPYPPVPEIVSETENPDGTITMEVHAVSSQDADDSVMISMLTIQKNADGSWQYLDNVRTK